MRVKLADVASGAHIPSGENMWASPADDNSSEKKISFKNELGNDVEISIEDVTDSGIDSKGREVDFDAVKITMVGPNSTSENIITLIEAENLRSLLNSALEEALLVKEALGLTSIPGEQQNDYQFEQPFHVKDPDNVGVVDVDTPLDLPPINYAEDSEMENKMKDLLEDLIEELESRGYSSKAEMIKIAYPGQTGQVPGYGSPYGKNKPYYPKNPPKAPIGYFDDLKYQTSDPNVDEFGEPYRSFTSINEMVKEGLLTREQAGWLIFQSKNQSFSPQDLQRILGLDIEYANQLSRLLLEQSKKEVQRPSQQAATSRALSGWDAYAASGRGQRALADAWQASPPQGFDASFNSFKAWYAQKFKELGRHFGPEEALVMIKPPQTPKVNQDVSKIPSQPQAEDLVGAKTRSLDSAQQSAPDSNKPAIAPTRENIAAALIRLMRGMPLTAPGIDGNILESGKISRMTKRYLRGIGADRTIRTMDDQNKVINLASTAITQVDLGGKSFEEAVNERLAGLDANEARKAFDGLVWQYLQRAWAAYGSLRGREVSDRREQRRLRRLERQTQRQIDKARNRS